MQRALTLATLAATLAVPTHAQGDYRPRGLLRTGYSDRSLGTGQWEVKASSHDEGGSVPVALYHAARIADANGITELRVVRQRVTISRMVMRSSGATVALTEKTVVTVRAIRTDADRTACDMPEAHRCLTLAVAGLLSAYGPRLGMPAARAGEVPAPPVLLTTTAPGWPFATTPTAAPSGGPFVNLLRGLVGQQARQSSPPAAHAPEPGVARATQVSYTSATTPPAAVRAPRPPLPTARVAAAKPTYEERLRAARPVDGDPRLGWTASD